MPYRKYPAEPFSEHAPFLVIDGGRTTAIPFTDRPILWRRGGN